MCEYQHELTSFQSEKMRLPRNNRRARYARRRGLGVGLTIGGGVAAAMMSLITMPVAHADTPDASELLAQAQQELSQANTDLGKAIDTATNAPAGTSASNELSSLGAQQDFQTDMGNFLNSLPANIPAADETNPSLVGALQGVTGGLGETWMVDNDASLMDNVANGGQAINLTLNNGSGWLNDGALMVEESAVQNGFNSLDLS